MAHSRDLWTSSAGAGLRVVAPALLALQMCLKHQPLGGPEAEPSLTVFQRPEILMEKEYIAK